MHNIYKLLISQTFWTTVGSIISTFVLGLLVCFYNLLTSETFWTAAGSIVSAFVLGLSVYQIYQQNIRQNTLDDRQKIIDDREAYSRETSQVTKIFTEHNFLTSETPKIHLNLTIHNKSEYPIYNVFVLGRWGRPIGVGLDAFEDIQFILFAGDEILPGQQPFSFEFPERDSGTRWPIEFSLVLEDVHKKEWSKNKNNISKLETSFFNTIYNKYKIKEIPIHKKDYWILENGICLQGTYRAD